MIIIKRKYIPTDASVIRAIALAKGIGETGEKVRLVFLMPNNGLSYDNSLENVSIEYIGENSKIKNKVFGLVASLIKLNSSFQKEEVVILMSFIFPVFFFLAMNSKIQLYHERTEYPPFIFGKRFWGKLEEFLYIQIIKKTKGVFVISNKLKTYFIENGIERQNVHTINMIVDHTRFNPCPNQHESDYIAYCGTIDNNKDGVDDLLRAFAIFNRIYPNIRLYLLGRTPHKKDLDVNNQIIQENQLSSKVYMPGLVLAQDIPRYLTNAKLLILARPNNIQAAYGFPTKLGEYLLTGNPVVVTRVGELDCFLKDKESCIFAEANNPRDIASKMLWVIDHSEKATIIGRNGRNVALKSFNYQTEAEKILRSICQR